MASQGEQEPGVDMCSSNLESMARDGTCNFNQRGSSTPYSEHGLCQQTESQDGGAASLQRGTRHERAAINGTTRGECSQQPPLQTTWARQADINGLRKQWEKGWKAELEEQKWRHDLAMKRVEEHLEREVGRGNRDRKSLEEKVKTEQERAGSELKKRTEEQKRKHELESKQLKEKIMEKSRQVEELQGERGEVERSTYELKKRKERTKAGGRKRQSGKRKPGAGDRKRKETAGRTKGIQ